MPIRELAPGRAWALEGRRTTFALAVDAQGTLCQTYYGPRLAPADDSLLADAEGRAAQAVFPTPNGARFGAVALRLAYADGVRDVRLRLAWAECATSDLTLVLRDEPYDLAVRLEFHLEEGWDLIRRRATVTIGRGGAVVRQAATGALLLPARPSYRLTHLVGRWAHETQVRRESLREGRKLLGNGTRGLTSHEHNPFFALDDGEAREEAGQVFFGALAYSGSWQLTYEHEPSGEQRLLVGPEGDDFAWRLAPGQPLVLPDFVHGLSLEGFGGMSRALHAYTRERLLPRAHAATVRPVVYNSWEATAFAVSDQGQRRLAARAAELGVEVFVLDDGWFGARTSDRAGLGDWEPNPERFPEGLEALIAHVHGLGMGFGLWVEPEAVNPDSDLYRAHSDWVYHFPGRDRTEVRNELVLNMARPEVAAFVQETMDRLLGRYAVDYVKWDMNRPCTEVGMRGSAPDPIADGESYLRHTQALYAILDHVRERHPSLWLEACAGGGGRADLGILARADQVWTSDNTFAADRLAIQEGYSLAYPACTMDAWVTDNREAQAPLAFRFHTAMAGVLGIGADIGRWSRREMAAARRMIEAYKAVRETVQFGDLYRLCLPSASGGGESALLYVNAARTEAVVFAFRLMASGLGPDMRILVPGLAPDRLYHLEGPGAPVRPLSGRALAHIGITLPLRGVGASAMLRIAAVAAG